MSPKRSQLKLKLKLKLFIFGTDDILYDKEYYNALLQLKLCKLQKRSSRFVERSWSSK